MNLRFSTFILGWLMLMTAALLLVPLLVAVIYGESLLPFAASIGIALSAGLPMIYIDRPTDRRIHPRDGFLIVGGAWIAISVIGALPYMVAGALTPVDAFFESVSGFTTTGSTVIADTSVISNALLLWRAMTQWVGGMGIILFSIAILPLLGIGGMQLFKAEVPGPVADKVQPRLVTTARSLWGVYVGLTLAEFVALKIAGLSAFDAICHSFTTLATGGFSTQNASVGQFGLPAVEWIITVFMILAGVNFVLHYRLLTGRAKMVWQDTELRYFLGVVAGAIAIFTITTHQAGAAWSETIRNSAFQTASLLTTTGYATTDVELWPPLALMVVFILMTLGGMSGSTGGGIKSLRALLALRSLRANLLRIIHPHAIRPVKYGNAVVSDTILSGIWSFLTAYLLITVFSAAVVAAYGYDVVTAFSASLTAISNVGPGLGEVGTYDNFSHFPGLVKIVLSLSMLFGRLEIFTLLAMLSREFWKR